jgi:hypothetical protein
MVGNSQSNILLSLLPTEEREALRLDLEALDVAVRHEVFRADHPIEHVYFPESCVISVHTKMQDGVAVEIVTVGREGIVRKSRKTPRPAPWRTSSATGLRAAPRAF